MMSMAHIWPRAVDRSTDNVDQPDAVGTGSGIGGCCIKFTSCPTSAIGRFLTFV